ncbi:MAG: glycosyltransferase family 4 protein [Thermoplasmata archaeon]|nr:glycosyltransferase family 4 protein [Thermoplasmata archaeon]
MKIAQVTLRFDAPGGVEFTVRELTKRFVGRGHSVDVYASDLYDEAHWDRRADFRATVDGARVHRFPVYKRVIPGLTLPLWPGLMTALADSEADVIHAHSHRYGHVLQAAAVGHHRDIPVVISTHYHPADRREPPIKRGLLRVQDVGFGATAYRHAAALVVETELEARLVGEFAPRHLIHVIPPGIDLEPWSADAGAPPSQELPPRYLLYAGRIASNKGLPTLVTALARLPPSVRVPLVLMGPDWGERAALEHLADQLGVSKEVVWLGHVPDERQHREVFRRATLFVLPSEWEAFGLVLLEAMAAGCPIVATEVGAVPEVLEQGRAGRLVPYGDPDRLAGAIQELLEDPAKAQGFAVRGTQRVTQYGWEQAVDRHLELYRHVGGGPG